MIPDRSTQASQTQPTVQPTTQLPIQHSVQLSATPTPKLSSIDRQKLVTIRHKFQSQQWQKLPLGDRIQIIAEQFIGDPYRANLLDQSHSEQSFISLHQFDCVLFLETVLALTSTFSTDSENAQNAQAKVQTGIQTGIQTNVQKPPSTTTDITKSPPLPESNLIQNLQQYRYRDGRLDNYCSRLHYFSDWILDNQQRGLIQDLGTVPLQRSINFMSQNWKKYSPIVRNPSLKDCIQTTESDLTQKLQAGQLKYIPIESLRSQENKLRSGDLIGLVTDLKGLDVTHSGFLYRTGTQAPAGLLHASQRSGIKISPNLESYVRGVDGAIGITVARPIEQSKEQHLKNN